MGSIKPEGRKIHVSNLLAFASARSHKPFSTSPLMRRESARNKRGLFWFHSEYLPLQKTNRNFLPSGALLARYFSIAFAAARVNSTLTLRHSSLSLLNWLSLPPIALGCLCQREELGKKTDRLSNTQDEAEAPACIVQSFLASCFMPGTTLTIGMPRPLRICASFLQDIEKNPDA